MPSEDTKPVKAEIEEAEDKKGSGSKKVSKATNENTKAQPKLSKVKKEEAEEDDSRKPIKAASGSRPKAAKVKKEENDDEDDHDYHKPLAQRNSNIKLEKEQKKKRKIKEEEKKKKKKKKKKKGMPAAEHKKREKKVYDLPGQKRDPPEERDPLRIFYETLYEQVPHSEMAQVWMMESGLLPVEEARKVYEKKQKKGLQQKLTSPVKALTSKQSSTHSVTVKKNISSSSIKKKTTGSAAKQPKKREADDMSSEAEEDSDNDPILKRVKRKEA